MKEISILFIVLVCAIACGKSDMVDPEEIPQWLKTEIQNMESEMFEDPHSMHHNAAWIRYTYKNNFYYEYYSPLMSSFPKPYDESRAHAFLDPSMLETYRSERKNKKYVWKGPRFTDIN